MRRKRFYLSLLADVIALLGMVAIVVGIALMGRGPLAVIVAGAELILLGVLLSISQGRAEGGEGG